jgi:hypothetical protein
MLSIYGTNTGKQIAAIKLNNWARVIGFSPDCETILVGGSEFVIYSAKNGKKIRTIKLLDDVDSHKWSE